MCSVQFLVSKLVACFTPSKTKDSCDSNTSQVLSLLRILTVDSDPSMHDYVKVSVCIQLVSVVLRICSCYALWMHEVKFLQELEPFPELKIFDEIRKFHEELCHSYSICDHLLKVNNLCSTLHLCRCKTSSFKLIPF